MLKVIKGLYKCAYPLGALIKVTGRKLKWLPAQEAGNAYFKLIATSIPSCQSV